MGYKEEQFEDHERAIAGSYRRKKNDRRPQGNVSNSTKSIKSYTGKITAEYISRELGGTWKSKTFGAVYDPLEGEGQACCPSHDDHNPSLSISYKEGKILIHCWAGCTFSEITAALIPLGLWRNPTSQLEDEYTYEQADGTPYLQVRKFVSVSLDTGERTKKFPQFHWTGTGWKSGKPKGPSIPYRLREFLNSNAETPVFICEGEKDADNVRKHGFTATTCPEGAKNWKPSLNPYFKGRSVIILRDNDEAGAQHADIVARALVGLAGAIRVILLTGLPPKGDVSDWLATNDPQSLLDLCLGFPEYAASQKEQGKTEGIRDKLVIQSSAEFIADYVPPDYLIDGIVQRSFVYSLTAKTGAGKTAITLAMALEVARGGSFAGTTIDKGKVLYLAGENPNDHRNRWIAMGEHLGFNPSAIDVYFMPNPFGLSEAMPRIRAKAEELGGIDLVIVDTAPAYFQGEDENDNVELGNHARDIRELTTIKGTPAVIANCHPVKRANADDLIPRGGGAFLAEVDGNFCCMKKEAMVEFHWQGKLRGPDFEPIAFEIAVVTAEKLKDSKGRNLLTAIARFMSHAEHQKMEDASQSRQHEVLGAMLQREKASIAELASDLGWFYKDGAPNKSKVNRLIEMLRTDKLVTKVFNRYLLTKSGRVMAREVASATGGAEERM